MSEEQLKSFLEKVKGDTSLQEKLEAAKSSDEVVNLAREHGFEFGSEHITELTDDDLDSVSGGTRNAAFAQLGRSWASLAFPKSTTCYGCTKS